MNLKPATPGLLLAVLVTLAMLLLACSADASEPCAEDQSCWTWSTMGNQQRGVHVRSRAIHVGADHAGQRDRRWRVVNPCEFSYLSHEGLLTSRTKRLRGDLLAERHGCDYRYFG